MNSSSYDFVIITPGRSGSDHLSETLNNCVDIFMSSEIFNRNEFDKGSFNHFLTQSKLNRAIAFLFNREKISKFKLNIPLKVLVNGYLNQKIDGSEVIGFKVSLDQLEAYPQVIDWILKNNIKVIYLYRHDRIAQVLSLIKARKTNSYIRKSELPKNSKLVFFDKKEVLKLSKELATAEKKLLAQLSAKSYISLTYEDLFENYDKSFNMIRNYIGLPPVSKIPFANIIKSNPKNLTDWVANLDEIVEYLNAQSISSVRKI